jgi:hypothetical protein
MCTHLRVYNFPCVDVSSLLTLAKHALALEELHLQHHQYTELSPLSGWAGSSLRLVTLIGGRALKEPTTLLSAVLSCVSTLEEVEVHSLPPVFKHEEELGRMCARLPALRALLLPNLPLTAKHFAQISGVHLTTLDLSANLVHVNDLSVVSLTHTAIPALCSLDIRTCCLCAV